MLPITIISIFYVIWFLDLSGPGRGNEWNMKREKSNYHQWIQLSPFFYVLKLLLFFFVSHFLCIYILFQKISSDVIINAWIDPELNWNWILFLLIPLMCFYILCPLYRDQSLSSFLIKLICELLDSLGDYEMAVWVGYKELFNFYFCCNAIWMGLSINCNQSKLKIFYKFSKIN